MVLEFVTRYLNRNTLTCGEVLSLILDKFYEFYELIADIHILMRSINMEKCTRNVKIYKVLKAKYVHVITFRN